MEQQHFFKKPVFYAQAETIRPKKRFSKGDMKRLLKTGSQGFSTCTTTTSKTKSYNRSFST